MALPAIPAQRGSLVERVGSAVRSAVGGAVQRIPHVRGTTCTTCGYEVPALGLPPDWELAWFERFEGKPCPNCCGLAIGMVAGVTLAAVLKRVR